MISSIPGRAVWPRWETALQRSALEQPRETPRSPRNAFCLFVGVLLSALTVMRSGACQPVIQPLGSS